MSTLLIYGATGYTGRMAAVRAKMLGLNFEIAGHNHDRLASLAKQLDVPFRVFACDAQVEHSLNGISVLLNFAGPFAHTADALMRACIKVGSDYLDIAAEMNVYRLAERLGTGAADAGVMLLPGVGWDVIPTDCLAVHVARRVLQSQRLSVALQVPGSMSRPGPVRTVVLRRSCHELAFNGHPQHRNVCAHFWRRLSRGGSITTSRRPERSTS